jgi:hypothetical protein
MTGNPIIDSALILGGVGLFFGFLIAMANKKFSMMSNSCYPAPIAVPVGNRVAGLLLKAPLLEKCNLRPAP